MRTPRRITLLFSLMVLAACVWAAAAIEAPRKPLPSRVGPELAAAKSWGYQRRNVDPALLPPQLDVLVVDYSQDGGGFRAWTPEEVEALRRSGAGGQRIVLSYLSIGRAESTRFYWWGPWALLGPSWLGSQRPQDASVYDVRYWEPGWQRILYEARPSLLERFVELHLTWRKPYLDRVLEAGFDGVYLDGVDAFAAWQAERPSAIEDMVRLVAGLSAYAKARKPGFLVMVQNGEALLREVSFRAAVDGIAREGLLFGDDGGKPAEAAPANPAAFEALSQYKSHGGSVFLTEYVADAERQAVARTLAAEQGFVLLFAAHGLDRPPLPPAPDLRSSFTGSAGSR